MMDPAASVRERQLFSTEEKNLRVGRQFSSLQRSYSPRSTTFLILLHLL